MIREGDFCDFFRKQVDLREKIWHNSDCRRISGPGIVRSNCGYYGISADPTMTQFPISTRQFPKPPRGGFGVFV